MNEKFVCANTRVQGCKYVYVCLRGYTATRERVGMSVYGVPKSLYKSMFVRGGGKSGSV